MMKREVREVPVALEPGDLGKPLADHVERSAVAGTLDDDGQLVVEDDVESDRLPGADFARKGDARVGLVVVARALQFCRRPEVDAVVAALAVVPEGELLDVDPPPVLWRFASATTHPFA